MRVRVLTKAAEETGMEGPPTAEMLKVFGAMDTFAEALVKAGVFVVAAGFKRSSETRRIVADGKHRAVLDDPFAETGEVIHGFSVWQLKAMDESIRLGEARARSHAGPEERVGNPAILHGGWPRRFPEPRGGCRRRP
jgi:hypothetical protein